MEHELHETAVAVAGEIARIGAGEQRGNLRAGEDGGQAARTGHGTRPFLLTGGEFCPWPSPWGVSAGRRCLRALPMPAMRPWPDAPPRRPPYKGRFLKQ